MTASCPNSNQALSSVDGGAEEGLSEAARDVEGVGWCRNDSDEATATRYQDA